MSEPGNPMRNPAILIKDIGGEAVLYSAEQKAIHVLNPSARLVWELCDGDHSTQEIESEIRRRFSVDPNRNVLSDVEQTLRTFGAKRLIDMA